MFVDSHHHFWSTGRDDYGWLTPANTDLWHDALPPDLHPVLQRHGVTDTIVVQAAPSVTETDYLLGIADATPWVRGVVGWVDFSDPTHLAHITRWSKHPKFCGVRPMLQDIADPDWILAPALAPTFQSLIALDLVFEFLGTPRHLDTALTLFRRYPQLRSVIDHGMKPDIARNAFDPWGTQMGELATLPHVHCKLSGLVTEARTGWTLLDLKPYVDHIVSAFGAERVMWGSDWPVVNCNGGYDAWRAVTLALVGAHSGAQYILGNTARRFYRF
ncbi:MAG: amidohydrolase family protein [Hyphomicrobiaceae bacterium]|nr:amidohydrolase family protein [Hyphomicrobiaceae bacterium]